jgi:hypothetical protein
MVMGLSFTGKSAALAPVNVATASKLSVNSFFIFFSPLNDDAS